jgi:hypothetical protein
MLQNNKYNLVLCELYNRNIHGLLGDSIQEVDGHYLVLNKFNGKTYRLIDEDEYGTTDFTEDDDSDADSLISTISDFALMYNEYYADNDNIVNHIIIRNYQNIINKPNYIKPEIAQCIILETGHSIAIIKTLWIKFIQRKWKKIYEARKIIMRRRMSPSSLSTRELTGRWPSYCIYLPSIQGMLYDLNKNKI